MKWVLLNIICLLLLLTAGCERLIDFEERTDPDEVYTTLEGLEGSILGAYDRGRFVHGSDDFSMYKLCHSDEIKLGTNLADQPVFEQYAKLLSFDAANKAVEEIWNGYYTGLTIVNMILASENIVEIDNTNPDEVTRMSKVIGEASFFRAYFHLSLIERWDRIVLVDRVMDDPGQPIEIASSEDVYDLIVSDLLSAIQNLPDAEPGQPGKISKAVARHVLALVYMNLQRYSQAASMAKQVIEDPAYALLSSSNLADVFSCQHQDNSEIIFSWQFSPYDRNHPQRCSTQLLPLYNRVFGVVWSWDGGGRPWSRLLPSDYYWTLFEKNDLRLEAWHKRYWTYNVNISYIDPLPPGVRIGDTITPENVAGTEENLDINLLIIPTTKKYWEDGSLGRQIDDDIGYRNIILYRLSQTYLIAAEALMRQGKVIEGQVYLDAIRARAGVGSIPLTEENLIDEQLRELGHEGHRFAFLKRLGLLYNRVQTYCPDFRAAYQPFHVRWPIPQQFIETTLIQQNEGY